MLLNLFKRQEAQQIPEEAQHIPWEKNAKGRFWKLLHVRPRALPLSGRGGVAAFFHRGVKPGWILVCASDDLGALIAAAQDDPQVMEYEGRGGVFVTWSFVKPTYREGIVAHFRQVLRPEITATPLDGFREYNAKPIPVVVPA